MKKAISLFAAILLCMSLFTGCDCTHKTWNEADCLNPKTCAKCGEPQGEALGHTWVDADCLNPVTCSACGETQGDSLGHEYGEWVVGEGDTMSRRCFRCEGEETVAVDYAQLLDKKLQGHWDLYSYIINDQEYSALYLKEDCLGMYLSFSEGMRVNYFQDDGDFPKEITWEFSHYDVVNGNPCYYFTLIVEEGIYELPAFYVQGETADYSRVVVSMGENYHAVLHTGTTIAQGVAGTWAYMDNGQLITLNLEADRTFTCNLGDGISGTWHLSPIYETWYSSESYSRECNILLRYWIDGSYQVTCCYLELREDGEDGHDFLRTYPLSIRWDDFDSNQYYKYTQEELEQLSAGLAEASSVVVGSWVSKKEQNIVFIEDGTLLLNNVYAGTWSVDDVRLFNGSIHYNYTLKIDGYGSDISAGCSGDTLLIRRGDAWDTDTYFKRVTE